MKSVTRVDETNGSNLDLLYLRLGEALNENEHAMVELRMAKRTLILSNCLRGVMFTPETVCSALCCEKVRKVWMREAS